MKRVALLGATGSIGAQAIEIVGANPDLELCALMSGRQPLDPLAASLGVEHIQVGGSACELLDASEPDIVLNAIVGFAGVEATLWALERGVTLALANKESLVAAGELAVAAHRRGGGLLLPVDSEHSALFQCLEGRAPDTVAALVLTASGGPFRGYAPAELDERDRRGRARPSDLVDGTKDHCGLRHSREQGPRADRGALAVRPARTTRSRSSCIPPPSSTRSSASATVLCSRTSGARTCACRSRSRSRFRSAPPSRQSRSISPPGSSCGSRLPTTRRSRSCRWRGRRGSSGGTYPCAYNAANEVAVAAFLDGRIGFTEIAATVADALDRVDGAPAGDLDELVAADAEARRAAEQRLGPGMTIFISIVGLGLLVFVHELGHFAASLALRMRPRKFYIGFPPAAVKRTRNGIEYGIGMIPLGGFVKIPGMHRPAPADVDPVFGRAVEEAPELAGAADRLRRSLGVGDHDAARAIAGDVRRARGRAARCRSRRRTASRRA